MFSHCRIRVVFKALVLLFSMMMGGATAGVHSSVVTAPVLESSRIAKFAQQLERTLADSGARVAIIARTGRPETQLPDGVRYTHVAFAVYSTVYAPDGTRSFGYAIYNLYRMQANRNSVAWCRIIRTISLRRYRS